MYRMSKKIAFLKLNVNLIGKRKNRHLLLIKL